MESVTESQKVSKRFLVGVPLTGLVRSEWAMAKAHQIIPCNWSQVEMISWLSPFSPLRHLVADARNVISTECVEKEYEWLFFIDHDVVLPAGTLVAWNQRMLKGDVPVWSGLYFAKGKPAEPLIFRGRGNSYYPNWKLKDLVWADGIPMGCTMIHGSILKALYNESEEYEPQKGQRARRIFETPQRTWYDPETNMWNNSSGTEDLNWCTRVMEKGIFKKAGWPKYQKKKYPFLVDTNIFCRHIDWDGVQYPVNGEEKEFEIKKK